MPRPRRPQRVTPPAIAKLSKVATLTFACTRTTGGGVQLCATGARPFTTNRERAATTWRDVSAWTRLWRRNAYYAALNLSRRRVTPPVEIEITPLHANARSPQDTGACHPAAKAVIDGLVDAHVIPDDDPTHVHRHIYNPPRVGTLGDGLLITLTPCHCPTCTTKSPA